MVNNFKNQIVVSDILSLTLLSGSCKPSIFCEDMNKKCTLNLYHDIHMKDWLGHQIFLLWSNMVTLYGEVSAPETILEDLMFLKILRSHYSVTFRVFILKIFQSCLTFTESYCVELFRCHNGRKLFSSKL